MKAIHKKSGRIFLRYIIVRKLLLHGCNLDHKHLIYIFSKTCQEHCDRLISHCQESETGLVSLSLKTWRNYVLDFNAKTKSFSFSFDIIGYYSTHLVRKPGGRLGSVLHPKALSPCLTLSISSLVYPFLTMWFKAETLLTTYLMCCKDHQIDNNQ